MASVVIYSSVRLYTVFLLFTTIDRNTISVTTKQNHFRIVESLNAILGLPVVRCHSIKNFIETKLQSNSANP